MRCDPAPDGDDGVDDLLGANFCEARMSRHRAVPRARARAGGVGQAEDDRRHPVGAPAPLIDDGGEQAHHRRPDRRGEVCRTRVAHDDGVRTGEHRGELGKVGATTEVDAVHAGDYSLVLGVTTVSILGVSIAVLLIDLLYPLIDPRVTVT